MVCSCTKKANPQVTEMQVNSSSGCHSYFISWLNKEIVSFSSIYKHTVLGADCCFSSLLLQSSKTSVIHTGSLRHNCLDLWENLTPGASFTELKYPWLLTNKCHSYHCKAEEKTCFWRIRESREKESSCLLCCVSRMRTKRKLWPPHPQNIIREETWFWMVTLWHFYRM